MVDKAKSILDKLKNKARNSGKSYQMLLQLFCQEEFLRRLSKSKYANNFILKGGLFLYSISNFDSRPTYDIDFMLKNQSNSVDNLTSILYEIIGDSTQNDFVTFELMGTEPISEHREYSGVRFKMRGIILNTKTQFDIDIGVGDVIVPKPQKVKMPTQLEGFESPEIIAYSIESVIAEKLDTIINRMKLTSRMKDFYDIYYISNTWGFDGRKLQQAIFETLENRKTIYEKNILEEISKLKEDSDMLFKWKAFIKNSIKIDLGFEKVMDTIVKFIVPVFKGIINENEFFGQWDYEKNMWIGYKE